MVKDMAKQQQYQEASIARVYSEYFGVTELLSPPPPVELDTRCKHTRRPKHYSDDNARVSDLLLELVRQEYNGADIAVGLWRVNTRALIGGYEFTCGESPNGKVL